MTDRWNDADHAATRAAREGRIWVISGTAVVVTVAVILVSIVAWVLRGRAITEAERRADLAVAAEASAMDALDDARERATRLDALSTDLERELERLRERLRTRDGRITALEREADAADRARARAESRLRRVEADLRSARREAAAAARRTADATPDPSALPLATLEQALAETDRVFTIANVQDPACRLTEGDLERMLQVELRRNWDVEVAEAGDAVVQASVIVLRLEGEQVTFVVELSVWARWQVPGRAASRLIQVWDGHIIGAGTCRALDDRVRGCLDDLVETLLATMRSGD